MFRIVFFSFLFVKHNFFFLLDNRYSSARAVRKTALRANYGYRQYTRAFLLEKK